MSLQKFPLMVLFLSIIMCMFIYKNSLFYVMSLLLISFSVLSYIVLYSYLNLLTVLMLVIVYVGAMMVLIGYICAISPNLILEPDFSFSSIYILIIVSMFMLYSMNFSFMDLCTSTMVDYFYSFQGIFMFITLALMLFVTLLMVTSQYSVPKGPFRSINS